MLTLDEYLVVEAQALLRYRCGACGIFLKDKDCYPGAVAVCKHGHPNHIS